MTKKSLLCASLLGLCTQLWALDYKAVPDWLQLPSGKDKLGSMHGDVAVSSKGEVYVSVMDPAAGVQVFSKDGKSLRNVPNAPSDFHGFVIRKQKDGEFIFGPRLSGQEIIKMTLDGEVVLRVPASVIPDEFKNAAAPKGKAKDKDAKKTPFVRLTGMDIAPNGDWFVTDGYSSDYVHRFDSKGNYLKSFGGRKKAPYNFNTLHKIAIDTRFSPPRIIGCDRENMRAVHMSLDGEFLGVINNELLRPAAVAIYGDYAAFGEIKGQVTLIDKAGKVVAKLGTNGNADEVATNKTEPVKWRPGIFTAPHGVAFDAKGDIFVSEYNVFGRVVRYNKQ